MYKFGLAALGAAAVGAAAGRRNPRGRRAAWDQFMGESVGDDREAFNALYGEEWEPGPDEDPLDDWEENPKSPWADTYTWSPLTADQRRRSLSPGDSIFFTTKEPSRRYYHRTRVPAGGIHRPSKWEMLGGIDYFVATVTAAGPTSVRVNDIFEYHARSRWESVHATTAVPYSYILGQSSRPARAARGR